MLRESPMRVKRFTMWRRLSWGSGASHSIEGAMS